MSTLKTIKTRLIEENFFRPRWYSVFINPYFISRISLYNAVRAFAGKTSDTATILDIGCGVKPYRSLFRSPLYTGIDIQGGGHSDDQKYIDAYYDGEHIPFPDSSFEIIICTQVLEHADDPETLIGDAFRVAKPGCRVLFSMPFVYMEHEIPYDFRRFTRFEHVRVMERAGFTDLHIQETTGFFGVFGQLFVVMCFESIRMRAPLFKALLTLCVFGPIMIVSVALDAIFRKPALTLDYIVTATKP